MTVDLQGRPVREALVGEAVGEQVTLTSSMQQIHFLGIPVSFRAAGPERQHTHVDQSRKSLRYGIRIQIPYASLAHGCVIYQDMGGLKLILERSLTCLREQVAYEAVFA
jgi:hypothetical protein